MIKIEGKTANKKLRIYRPDVSLPTICKTNGPAIVRKMIPCFPSLPDGNFYSTTAGNSFKDPKFSFIYGVNVRTPRVNSILPFSTTYKYDKKTGRGQILDDFKVKGEIDYKVPKFTDDYEIRELLLYAPLHKVEDGIDLCEEEVTILTLTTDKKLKKREYADYIRNLKHDLCKVDGFFAKQINALELENCAYLWLTSEDYNVNTGGDALSNVIAISDDYDAIAQYIMPHRLDFIRLLFLIKARYLFDAENAQLRTAVSSAKAAIMSRNMSHNLGSHVMAYLKQHLSSVQDMVRDNVLASLFSSKDTLTAEGLEVWWDDFKKSAKEQQEIALPFLVGLGKFISYLQERQDFIATIATDYVPYFSTVNFKDFIYDELNPDLRYQRHKDRIGLQPDNILLGNIARSEGLARTTNPTRGKKMSDIIIKYRHFDGQPVVDSQNQPLISVDNIEEKIRDLDDMREFMVQLPGGVVGRQAIFSIVENVIRNAAKHGKFGESSCNSLELTFDRYYLDDYINGNIREDYVPSGEETFKEFFFKYYAAASDIEDLCVITLTDNIPFEKVGTIGRDCKKLLSIRNALKEAYVDKRTVQMLQTNKGIKEMRISAAWLRGVEDDVKENPLYITPDFNPNDDAEDFWIDVTKYWNGNKQWVGKAPVLMVRACTSIESEDYHLQYIFCLPKPKYVALVLSEQEYKLLSPSVQSWFSKNSWGIFTGSSFTSTRNKSFEFIVLSDGISNKSADEIKKISPNRVIKYSQIESFFPKNSELLSEEFNDFKRLFILLYKHLSGFDPSTDVVVISDEKAGRNIDEEKPTNVIVRDGAFKGKYLYRTHNETEEKFIDYLKNADSSTIFVEGITGNNSTDRLVRNDKINELWLYKHLHAMKTTVGIFDERIFAKIYKKDEADIRIAAELNSLPSFAARKDMLYNDILTDVKLKKLIRAARTDKDIAEYMNVYGDYMSIAYEKKGVSVFNMLKTTTGIDIYGFGGIVENADGKYFGRVVKVGEIGMNNGSFFISNLNNFKFDYLSIHQGLLDKVYEQFDIRHDDKAKHDFTQAFYQSFCSSTEIIPYEDDNIVDKKGNKLTVYFLPNLRIHSGRSKPSFADMPQRQPFIQYAAIENAIMDCKYSLIELLDFARYE